MAANSTSSVTITPIRIALRAHSRWDEPAAMVGIEEQQILYSCDISHQQNRAFVNLLDIDHGRMIPTRGPKSKSATPAEHTTRISNGLRSETVRRDLSV